MRTVYPPVGAALLSEAREARVARDGRVQRVHALPWVARRVRRLARVDYLNSGNQKHVHVH